MRTKILVILAAAAMLLMGITAMSSNMGFKISIPLYTTGVGHSGANWVSLPFYNSYTTASVAFADIPNCGELDLYDDSVDGYRVYDGVFNTDDFPIATGGTQVNGNALLVKVTADGNWVVVGSHAPSLAVNLYTTMAGHSGANWQSIPYHTNKASASTLFAEITNCAELDLYDDSVDGYRVYDGVFNTDDFPITAGKAVLIKVSANTAWTPAHY
jgi:hypothetical protein